MTLHHPVILEMLGDIDPMALPEPWCWTVCYWMHHHPDRVFLPSLECPGTYRIDWDDLREILATAGVLDRKLIAN